LFCNEDNREIFLQIIASKPHMYLKEELCIFKFQLSIYNTGKLTSYIVFPYQLTDIPNSRHMPYKGQ